MKDRGNGYETYDLPGELLDIPTNIEQEVELDLSDEGLEEFFESLNLDDVQEIEY